MAKEFKTTHKLPFEVAASPYHFNDDTSWHQMFRVGTCEGQWGFTKNQYFILSVINKNPGNGHFDDVLEWFEHSAKRDNKDLLILHLMNHGFKKHLIAKKGFEEYGTEHCIKRFYVHPLKYTPFISKDGKKGLIVDVNK